MAIISGEALGGLAGHVLGATIVAGTAAWMMNEGDGERDDEEKKTGKKARDSSKNEPHVKADQRAHEAKLKKAEEALKEHQMNNRGTKGYGKIEKSLKQKVKNVRQEIEKGHHSQKSKKQK